LDSTGSCAAGHLRPAITECGSPARRNFLFYSDRGVITGPSFAGSMLSSHRSELGSARARRAGRITADGETAKLRAATMNQTAACKGLNPCIRLETSLERLPHPGNHAAFKSLEPFDAIQNSLQCHPAYCSRAGFVRLQRQLRGLTRDVLSVLAQGRHPRRKHPRSEPSRGMIAAPSGPNE
jgi:hypothetical protein